MWWLVWACGGDPDGRRPDPEPTPTPTPTADGDGDGFAADDCDDTDPEIHPGADERCDRADDDCDGLVDADDPGLVDGVVGYVDADADGAGDDATAAVGCGLGDRVPDGGDCDDGDDEVHPGAIDTCGDGVDQDCVDGDACGPRPAALPAAPRADLFQAQALQTAFVDAAGVPCAGAIAVALTDQALCWVAPDRTLRCAGRIWTQDFGASFTDAGLVDVDQVLLGPTVGHEAGDAACAVAGGVPTCVGYGNVSGQLGTGGTASVDDWTPWIAGSDLRWLATGTSDQYCGPDAAGAVWCVGDGIGPTPTVVDPSGTTVAIDEFGAVHVDDPSVWRVAQGRAACTVGAEGLSCAVGTFGRPGHVVDGGMTGMVAPPEEAVVWLEDDGTITLVTGSFAIGALTRVTLPTPRPALAMAYGSSADALCVVTDDGALSCRGENRHGMFGTGSERPLASLTEVLPPGSIDTTCQ